MQSCTTDVCVMHFSACPMAVGLCYHSACYVIVRAYTWAHFLQHCRDQKVSRVELHCLFVQSVNVLLIFPGWLASRWLCGGGSETPPPLLMLSLSDRASLSLTSGGP